LPPPPLTEAASGSDDAGSGSGSDVGSGSGWGTGSGLEEEEEEEEEGCARPNACDDAWDFGAGEVGLGAFGEVMGWVFTVVVFIDLIASASDMCPLAWPLVLASLGFSLITMHNGGSGAWMLDGDIIGQLLFPLIMYTFLFSWVLVAGISAACRDTRVWIDPVVASCGMSSASLNSLLSRWLSPSVLLWAPVLLVVYPYAFLLGWPLALARHGCGAAALEWLLSPLALAPHTARAEILETAGQTTICQNFCCGCCSGCGCCEASGTRKKEAITKWSAEAVDGPSAVAHA
jgi:hypothetical protein